MYKVEFDETQGFKGLPPELQKFADQLGRDAIASDP